jgi:hypothetical protein
MVNSTASNGSQAEKRHEILEGHGPTRCAQSEFTSLADTPPRRLRRDTQYMTPAPADTKAENRFDKANATNAPTKPSLIPIGRVGPGPFFTPS